MTITERSRHDMLLALEAAIGKEAAMTLAEHLPPVGWADVATRRDLDHLEAVMEHRFALVDARFDGIDRRLDQMDARFDGIDRRLDQMDTRLDGIDATIAGLTSTFVTHEHFDRRMAELSAEITEKLHQSQVRLYVAFVTTVVGFAAALIAAGVLTR